MVAPIHKLLLTELRVDFVASSHLNLDILLGDTVFLSKARLGIVVIALLAAGLEAVVLTTLGLLEFRLEVV